MRAELLLTDFFILSRSSSQLISCSYMQVTAKLLKLCLIICLMKIQVIKIITLHIPEVYCDLVQVQAGEPYGVPAVWLAHPHQQREEVFTWLVQVVS